MALEQSQTSPQSPRTNQVSTDSTTEISEESPLWHPHVYRTPPKSPTPFSIDDILHRRIPTAEDFRNSVAANSLNPFLSGAAGNFSVGEWYRIYHFLNNAMQQQQQLLNQNKVSSNGITSNEDSGRDSAESTPANSSSNTTTGDDDEAQPLNLSLTTNSNLNLHSNLLNSKQDPYERDFMMKEAIKQNGKFLNIQF